MTVVKGSKQQRMIVVPYRPWQTWVICVGIAVGMLVLACCFYFFGYNMGISENNGARIERDSLTLEIERYNEDIDELKQSLVNKEQTLEVNRQAITEVQEAMLVLRETNAELEEDVLFYKQVLAPEEKTSGLVIGRLDLVASEFSRVRYRIEFKQIGNNDSTLSGYANVTVLGMQDGQEKSMPLRSLSATEDNLDIKLRFKYFQNLEGELVLPSSFEPEQIHILAVTEGDESKKIEESFPWSVER